MQMQTETDIDTDSTAVAGQWPLWRTTLKAMREYPGFGYGATWETSWFEQMFCAERDSNDFSFQMLDLRQELESVDGYYLEANTIIEETTGIRKETWSIPDAAGHGDVATGFECKMRRYAHRSMRLLEMTLNNQSAKLSDGERSQMEKKQEIAATRLVLLAREKSIADYVRKTKPKALA